LSPAMLKMWISIAGIGLMFLAIITIYFSRYKLKGIFRHVTAVLAYLFMIIAGLTLFIVLFT
jgi:preprotein translocase subunit SecD